MTAMPMLRADPRVIVRMPREGTITDEHLGFGPEYTQLRDFLVVHDTPDMRLIIGHFRNCPTDANELLTRLARRLQIPRRELTIIREVISRKQVWPDNVEKLKEQFSYYMAGGEVDEGDEGDLTTIYRQLLQAGHEFDMPTTHAMESRIAEIHKLIIHDQDADGWTP